MELYKRLLKYIKPYYGIVIIAVLCALIVSAMNGIMPLLVKPLIDDVFMSKDLAMLNYLTLAVISVSLIKGLCRFFSSYFMSLAGHGIVMDMRNQLYNHIQTLSLKFFSDNHTGTLLSKVINDVSVIQGMVSITTKELITKSFSALALLGALFYTDWKLACISIFVLPVSGYLMSLAGKKLRHLGKKGQEQIADISSLLIETLTGIRIIKAFSREDILSEKFKTENLKFFGIMKKTIKYRELTSPLMEFVGAIGVALIIMYAGKSVIGGTYTPGNFFSFLTALLMLSAPIKTLGNINNKIQTALASAQRIFELLDIKPSIKEKDNAISLKTFSDEIVFDRISFKYDEQPIIDDISLTVKYGETIAIVGSSGAGKSTLINLISRFYDVTNGAIRIDGVDIRDVTLNSLRTNTGIVTQDIFLFNDTITNNIAFGNPDASEEQIKEAARLAHAHTFIMNLSDTYNTMVGERGVRLSGGEKQRIAIARALLKDPPIMILDEATSALDSESEHIVQQALNNLMKDRTTFVVAHRFSTILNADKIIVLEDGRIAETGTHDELLEKAGAYKKVYERQFLSATV